MIAAFSACVALINAPSTSCQNHCSAVAVSGGPLTLGHLLLCVFSPRRTPERPRHKECFLANSARVISISIKLIKTLMINILAFVLVSLIYFNTCSCSLPSFCPRGLN